MNKNLNYLECRWNNHIFFSNRTVSKIPIIFFAVHFRCIQYDNIKDFIPFFLDKGSRAHLDKILLLWNGALYPLYPSWVSPSFLILLMNVNVWVHPLCWIYYTTKLHFWKKYNLTFPIGNSRVLHIGISWWKAWIESVQDFSIKLDIKHTA